MHVLSAVGRVVARKNEDIQLNIVDRLQYACFERFRSSFRSIYIIITLEEKVFTNLPKVASDWGIAVKISMICHVARTHCDDVLDFVLTIICQGRYACDVHDVNADSRRHLLRGE